MKFKALLTMILAATSLLLFSGCGQEEPSSSSEPSSSVSSQEETTVSITLPASYFEGKTEKEVQEIAKKQGVDRVTKNEDGSYQYEMTATAHRRLLNEMRLSLVESIAELPDGTSYPSVKSAEISDDFSSLTLKVDAEAYKSGNDRTIIRAIWPSVSAYYAFNSEDPAEKNITVTVLEAEDGSQVEQFVWPESASSSKEESSQKE